jgi:predicted DNA-binding transcriptional regulator AlpA
MSKITASQDELDDTRPGKKRRGIAHAELIASVGDPAVAGQAGDEGVITVISPSCAGAPPQQIELWDVDETCAFFGGNTTPIHVSTLYRGVASKRYPAPINISDNVVRWIAHECRASLARIIARRDAGERTTPRPGAGRRERNRTAA